MARHGHLIGGAKWDDGTDGHWIRINREQGQQQEVAPPKRHHALLCGKPGQSGNCAAMMGTCIAQQVPACLQRIPKIAGIKCNIQGRDTHRVTIQKGNLLDGNEAISGQEPGSLTASTPKDRDVWVLCWREVNDEQRWERHTVYYVTAVKTLELL